MPTPVSCFSPFTPFTPASSAHGSGGYFDRPTPANRNVGTSFSRRPDLCNFSTSSSIRLSRVSAPIDSPRQNAENGWRMASRMREEALIAWEQQVRSNTNINNISTLRSPRQISGEPAQDHTQRTSANPDDKPRSTSSDRVNQGSPASRPTLRLSLHIQQALRKAHSENLVEQVAFSKLPATGRSFDRPCGGDNLSKHGGIASRV